MEELAKQAMLLPALYLAVQPSSTKRHAMHDFIDGVYDHAENAHAMVRQHFVHQSQMINSADSLEIGHSMALQPLRNPEPRPCSGLTLGRRE